MWKNQLVANSGLGCKNCSATFLDKQLARNSPTDSFENSNRSNDQQLNPANSQSCKSCIIERLSRLVLSESLSDVNFLVPKKEDENETSEHLESIPAHKLILSIGSPVFMAMFYGTGRKLDPLESPIRIPDVDSNTFKTMLKFVYTDQLDSVGPDSVMSLLYCAKKYAVESLERKCVDFLKCNLRTDNAFMLLEQALMFGEKPLVDSCLTLIDKNCDEVFSADCFLDAGVDTIILVIKRDSLGIREFHLFKHLIRWAENKLAQQGICEINCNHKRKVLDEVVKFIRFPLMSRDEFAIAMSDPTSRIIDDQEIIDLFINFTLVESQAHSRLKPTPFPKKLIYSHKPRCCVSGNEETINRFTQIESRWGYSGTSDRVRFSVDRRIFVAGFGLFGSIYGKCEYSVNIQLINLGSSEICAQHSTSFICDGSSSTFRVFFKEPVEILPEVDYVASATLKGPDSFYGTKGQRTITHESQLNGKVTFSFQYASGNNNGTSVEDGQIPEIVFLYSSY